MRWLRRVTRAVLAGALTAVCYPAWLVGALLLAGSPARRNAWRRWIFRAWSRGVLRVLGVRRSVSGTPPEGAFLLVSNHLSYLDVPLLASELGAVFVSKSEVADWPVAGRLSRSIGTIFVERGRKRQIPRVNASIAGALGEGRGVVVFPEGTSSKGEAVARFRTSLLAPAAEGGWRVHTATVHYATRDPDPPASLAVCWWGDMGFLAHLRELLGLRLVEARVTFGAEPVRERDRKLLAEKLWQAIQAGFIPVA